MRCVILRDDDTNALTPPDTLERLYRPFLNHGFAVNLAVIPEVATNTQMADGSPEGFLLPLHADRLTACAPLPSGMALEQTHGVEPGEAFGVRRGPSLSFSGHHNWNCGSAAGNIQRSATLPIRANPELVSYLKANPGYHIVQHGCHHDPLEFDSTDRADIAHRLQRGASALMEAGFPQPQTFVAPYDRLSRASLVEVAARFRVLSTGWYEGRRLPPSWWPAYALKKLRHASHWRIGQTLLLSHPGCLLSYRRPLDNMLAEVFSAVESSRLTVLVTHWWEYFRNGQPDEPFITVLHEVAAWLACQRNVKVLAFDDLRERMNGLMD
jgi:Uncharacterized protein conserved in bacteria (DUF2334)